MSDEREAVGPLLYQIQIQGRLDPRWSDWFSGLAVRIEDEDPLFTTLEGSVDQATLRGILNRIWDLNLTLVSVSRVSSLNSQ